MKIKVCHVAANVNSSLLLEAIAKSLDPEMYEFSAVFLHPRRPAVADRLVQMGFSAEWFEYSSRRHLPSAILYMRRHFAVSKPDIVHTHLVEGSIAGLTAAVLCGIKRRVHTRHHGSECHTYYPHGVYYDRFINRLSKRIVAITNVVRETLVELEGVAPGKISVINHGYDLEKFSWDEETTAGLRRKYGLDGHSPVIGVISRFVHWKGVQYIIPAFAKLAKDYPDAKLVLANASGNYADEINAMLTEHLRPEQYVCIDFEPKIFDLYKTFDVFVHVPIDRGSEAFGQTYIEPLYLGIPSVFTLSGVANDFIRNDENGVVVPYRDSDAIHAALAKVLSDRDFRLRISSNTRLEIERLFGLEQLGRDLDRFYCGL